MTEASLVRGACPHDCPDTCALLTRVEEGRAVKVMANPAHRHTDGVLCTKVSRYTERTYSPERVLYPLRRTGPKGSRQFERISWDAAIAESRIASDPLLREIRKPYCPTAMPAPWG